MATRVSPTKGNLMKIKKSLELAKVGYDLLDRKRNILIRETMGLIDSASDIRRRIAESYRIAYQALEEANMSMGIVDDFAAFVPVENGLSISTRSVMGVEIPTVSLDAVPTDNYFGFRRTTAKLDEAYRRFNEVKQLTAELAQTENSVYRLATGIKKAQKRANALKNIIIPRFEEQVKTITAALDEKDREEFSRLKVIKSFIDERSRYSAPFAAETDERSMKMCLSNLSFEYLNNTDFSAVAVDIFDILADNMTAIAPTGNAREEDYSCWYAGLTDALELDSRQLIIIKDSGNIIGFFQYSVNNNTFMMEEIQLRPEYQGKGVFRALYGFVIRHISAETEFVEAYANIGNGKSIGILQKFGLQNIGRNKNGRSYHFKGSYSSLLKWFNGR